MIPYKNLSGNSGVLAYEIGEDFIKVKFQDGECYRYNNEGVGKDSIMEMKRLAVRGQGLATYINTHPHVKKGFTSIEV